MNQITNAEQAILEVSALKKYFPVRKGFFQRISTYVKAVDGVDLAINKAQTLGLVGESGCGKSTLARLILRLLTPDEGTIVYRGVDISRFSEKELKPTRKELQIVFQDPYGSLNPRMTIGGSISEGLRIAGVPRGPQRQKRLGELLEMVGMSADILDRYPHEFSGGQRQRIGIARSLSVEPSLIVCDEPISALDVSIQAQIINLLKDLQDQLGLSYLFISHDLNVVGYLCHRIAVMYKGHIVEYASAESLFANPLHPYTLTLLAAIPEPELHEDKSASDLLIEAAVTDDPQAGCKFQANCPLVESHCRKAYIELENVSDGHQVRCWKVV